MTLKLFLEINAVMSAVSLYYYCKGRHKWQKHEGEKFYTICGMFHLGMIIDMLVCCIPIIGMMFGVNYNQAVDEFIAEENLKNDS